MHAKCAYVLWPISIHLNLVAHLKILLSHLKILSVHLEILPAHMENFPFHSYS